MILYYIIVCHAVSVHTPEERRPPAPDLKGQHHQEGVALVGVLAEDGAEGHQAALQERRRGAFPAPRAAHVAGLAERVAGGQQADEHQLLCGALS